MPAKRHKVNTALQMWNEKQALAAQWKVNLQALASCDWENGQEFDLSLEEADERFVRLNELIRAYMQAKKNQKAADDTAETAQEWYSQLFEHLGDSKFRSNFKG